MKTERTPDELESIYAGIADILISRGAKSCTMDLVAAGLGMSKRTLYEIFDSKDDMLIRVIGYLDGKLRRIRYEIFESSSNTMEAMARQVYSMQDMMQRYSPDFLSDIHNLPCIREHSRRSIDSQYRALSILTDRGVREGVFRKEVDYPFSIRMLRVQFEALRFKSDFLPEGFTIPHAFSCISISFLRSIATPRGMEILDNFTLEHKETTPEK